MAVRGSYEALTGSTWRLLEILSLKISTFYCRVSYVAVTRIPSLVLRNTWHYVIIRRRKFRFPKFVLRCSYEVALRKGVTTALDTLQPVRWMCEWMSSVTPALFIWFSLHVCLIYSVLFVSMASWIALQGFSILYHSMKIRQKCAVWNIIISFPKSVTYSALFCCDQRGMESQRNSCNAHSYWLLSHAALYIARFKFILSWLHIPSMLTSLHSLIHVSPFPPFLASCTWCQFVLLFCVCISLMMTGRL